MGTTNDDLMRILMELNNKVDSDNKDMKAELLGLADKVDNVKLQVGGIAEKVDKVKLQVDNKEVLDEKRMKRMDARMNKLETAMIATSGRNKDQSDYRRQLAAEQEERVRNWKSSVGLLDEKGVKKVDAKDTRKSEIVEDTEADADADSKENSYSSSWARALSGQLNEAAEEMKEIEQKKAIPKDDITDLNKVKKTKQKAGMKALRRWFGDDSEAEDNSTSSSDSETEGWTTLERQKKKNKEKIKQRLKTKNLKVCNTLNKANHIIGLGNISRRNIDHFMKDGATFSEAKKEAVKEFLNYVLGFSDSDISEMKIGETQLAANDDLIYTAFDNMEDIKDIRRRVIDCGNTDVTIRDFIPPQIYERVKFLNKVCADMRLKNPLLKTQIRLGVKDVEVYLKEKGTEEPYKMAALRDIVDIKELPRFDHEIRWNRRSERMPRKSFNFDSRLRPSSKTPHLLSRQSSSTSSSTGPVQDKKRPRTVKSNSQLVQNTEATEAKVTELETEDMQTEVDGLELGEEADFEGIEEYEDVDDEEEL